MRAVVEGILGGDHGSGPQTLQAEALARSQESSILLSQRKSFKVFPMNEFDLSLFLGVEQRHRAPIINFSEARGCAGRGQF